MHFLPGVTPFLRPSPAIRLASFEAGCLGMRLVLDIAPVAAHTYNVFTTYA